jgi:hypothetical protein
MKKIALYLFFCFWLQLDGYSQFVYKTAGLQTRPSLSKILNSTVLNNSTSSIAGNLLCKIEDEDNGQILTVINWQNTSIPQGITVVNLLGGNKEITYQNADKANSLRVTEQFAPGNYRVCWVFDPTDKSLDKFTNEYCVSFSVEAQFQINLIYPADQDSICINRPNFTWQGKQSNNPNGRYKIVCVELAQTDNKEEAIVANLPLFVEFVNTTKSLLTYPGYLPKLEQGKKYAWAVFEADQPNGLSNRSEVNAFYYTCPFETDSSFAMYAEPQESYTGKRYAFKETILITYQNTENTDVLSYQLFDEEENKKMASLPVIRLKKGLNHLTIPVYKFKNLLPNKKYRMEIQIQGKMKQYFLFTIIE